MGGEVVGVVVVGEVGDVVGDVGNVDGDANAVAKSARMGGGGRRSISGLPVLPERLAAGCLAGVPTSFLYRGLLTLVGRRLVLRRAILVVVVVAPS
jgi:hypothetical protein